MDIQYCDPTKTCATVQPGISSKLGSTELLTQREERSAYQSLRKDLPPNIGDYQSLVKVGLMPLYKVAILHWCPLLHNKIYIYNLKITVLPQRVTLTCGSIELRA